MPRCLILFAILSLIPLSACRQSEPDAEQRTEGQAASETVPDSVTAELLVPVEAEGEALLFTARLLSGVTVDESVQESLNDEKTADLWIRHQEEMQHSWATLEERHLKKMSDWSGEALAHLQHPSAPLFYPFGGPDLPSAHQFFPQASSYLLVGLEPVGSLPQLEEYTAESLETELERLRRGLDNLVESGYFVAKEMRADFAFQQRLDGFVPVLYISLIRAGFTPLGVRFVDFDLDGTLVYPQTVTAETAYGVEIRLGESAAPTTDTTRTLYYFSQDLSNEGLASKPGFLRYLQNLDGFNVYMKSAMYLPPLEDFGTFNELVLEYSYNVLQDDSGIPLREFDEADWQMSFFGVYTGTLPAYREWQQEDLLAAYADQAEQIPALPFAIGYNSRMSGSVLMWGERKGIEDGS